MKILIPTSITLDEEKLGLVCGICPGNQNFGIGIFLGNGFRGVVVAARISPGSSPSFSYVET